MLIPVDARECPSCKRSALVSVLYPDSSGYDRDECLVCGCTWANDPPVPSRYAKRPVMVDTPDSERAI